MPRNVHYTRAGFFPEFDLRLYGGEEWLEIYDVGLINFPFNLPGPHLDPIHACNGFGSTTGADLSARLTEAWQNTLGNQGTITLSIDGDTDRIRITYAGGAISLVMRPASADNPIGLAAGGILIAAPGGTHLCAGEWKRGTLNPSDYYILDDGVTTQVSVGRVQDLRVALRVRNSPFDLDDTGIWCLEDELEGLTWGVQEDGRIWWASEEKPTVIGGLPSSWGQAAIMRRLGFTGLEPMITWGTGLHQRHGQVATYPVGVCPSRPLRRQLPRVESVGGELRLTDGRYSGVTVGTYPGWDLEGWIDGRLDLGIDQHRVWLDLITKWAPPGRPLTFYQDMGESRRASREPGDQFRDAYSSLYTSEMAGYRGRILCRNHPDTGRDPVITQEGLYMRRHPFRLVLDEREAGV